MPAPLLKLGVSCMKRGAGVSLRQVSIIVAFALFATIAEAQSFEGTWEWVSTEFVAGGSETPITTGHTIQLMFGADGAFVRYQDEVPVHVGSWWYFDIVIGPAMVGVLETDGGDFWWSQSLSFVGDDLALALADWVQLPSGINGPATRTESYLSRAAVSDERTSWGVLKLRFR